MAWKVYLYLCVAVFAVIDGTSMSVSLSKVGKTVRGSNITFTATVSNYNDPEEKLKFIFRDNGLPHHEYSIEAATNVTSWTVEYPKALYEAGDYTVTVQLFRNYYVEWFQVSVDRTTFQLTETLNGNLKLSQNNTDRPNNFVAVNKTVRHYIQLPENELKYIQGNSSTVVTYWFIDCMLMASTDDFSFNYTYADNMEDHHIEAILVVNNQPLKPITTTTTTTSTTTTEKPTTIQPNTTTQSNETLLVEKLSNVTLKRLKRNADNYLKCNNTITSGDNYTYGRFESTLSVREPISVVNITGMDWLQHGDLLDLKVKYTGTPPFDYCYLYKLGQYNVTGNETCKEKTRTISNVFPIIHYFSDSDQHTVVVVIENEIGKFVSRATINIYKATVHPQLSVIVIPVFFCLVAVILVVFGIAYYQHRSRHTVEVADFDFGQAHPDYKTFGERLRDSFRNAFNFGNHDDTDPLTPNSRYDSM